MGNQADANPTGTANRDAERAKGDPSEPPQDKADGQRHPTRGGSADHTEANWERRHSAASLWINGIIGAFAIAGFLALLYQITSGEAESQEGKRAIAEALQAAARTAKAAETAAQVAHDSLAVTRESVELTRRQLATTAALERALLVIEHVTQPSLSSPFDPVVVTVKNVGRVPAQSIEMTIHSNGSGLETERPCEWSPKGIGASAVAPGQEARYATAGIPMNQETANRIVAKRAKLFLWVSVSYNDAFGPAKRDVSCYVVTGTGSPNVVRGPTNPWRPCEGRELKPKARIRCKA